MRPHTAPHTPNPTNETNEGSYAKPLDALCVRRGELLLVPSRCYDAAGAAGGFGRVLGPLRGGGDGVMQVGGTKYKVLAHAYMPGTPSIFFLARASHVEPLDPRKGPKTRLQCRRGIFRRVREKWKVR